jgi:cytochrome c-type biogenesis protein CcmH/NrfG
MGLALMHLDRDAEAREAFAAVVQQEPTNVAARVNLAYALANTGRLGDSVREFRRAAELETDPAGRATIEGAIAQLLGAH